MTSTSEHRGKNGFIFLCDQTTEAECLKKLLVGTTQSNAIWCMSVKEGDDIYLFNFNTGIVRGPYTAASNADQYDREAWGGKFPIQVKISKTSLTRQTNNSDANSPAILRKKRPSGALHEMTDRLFLWSQEAGILVE